MRRSSFVGMVAWLFLFSGGLAVAQAPQPLSVRFGYITGIAFPTYIIAETRGYFAKEGLAPHKNFLAGSGPVAEALSAGNLDLGNSSPTSSIIATARGGKTVMVSGYESSFTEASGKGWEAAYIVVRGGEGIKTLEDLKGKRIAVNDIGSAYNYFLRAHYIKEGLNPDKDVTIIPMPFGQMAGALVQKQVDAMVATADGLELARQRLPVDIIGSQSSLEGLDMGLSSCISVNTDFLKTHRKEVVDFLKALLQARLWINEAIARNDPALFDAVDKSMKFSPERSKSFWETRGGYYGRELALTNMLDVPRRLVDRQVELLKVAGIVKQDLPYEKLVDIGPLKEAYAALNLTWDEAKH